MMSQGPQLELTSQRFQGGLRDILDLFEEPLQLQLQLQLLLTWGPRLRRHVASA
jgi:hypothetical protein